MGPFAEELHVDLSAVDSLSSAGLGLLVSLHRRLVRSQGRLVVANAADHVLELLQLTRLDTLLDVRFEHAAQASALLNPRQCRQRVVG